MTLLYFSPLPWNSFSQRPHYFVRWYQAQFGGQIVWIDPYPSRFPKWADLKQFAHRRSDWQSDTPSWLQVIRPRLLPIEPIEKLAWINRCLWKIQMKYWGFADVFNDENASIKVVIAKHSDIALMTVMNREPESCMSDVMDDFAAFHQGMASARLRDLELVFLKHTKTIWTSSTALFEKFSELHSNTHCVFNGLESTAFQTTAASAPKLDARPVAGYVGTIGEWFDWDWLASLAKALPEYAIDLIGPLHVKIPRNLPENIQFFDPLTHADALKRMRSFKLALIPFKINQLTRCVDPIKYYEYKALGLPIISTNFGEMAQHQQSKGVFACHDESSIKAAIELAIDYVASTFETTEFIKNNSWQQRFDAAASTIPWFDSIATDHHITSAKPSRVF